MRVLWITNGPIAFHRKMLNIGLNQGGGWMEISYRALNKAEGITLGVATVYNIKVLLRGNDGGNKFYILPSARSLIDYDINNLRNRDLWADVIKDFNPDLIQIWGTEAAFGLCAIKVALGIPTVIYMQGLISQIANHYYSGINFEERLRNTTIRDVLLGRCFWQVKKQYRRRIKLEKEILVAAGKVIVENEWCASHCLVITGGCDIYKSLLPINSVFASRNWSQNAMKPHTIFTVSEGGPIKGFHMMLKALSIVIQKYPDTVLHIPGYNSAAQDTGMKKLFRSSYVKYTLDLEKKYNLSSHIKYIGKLSPEQMVEHMQKANVFVMPSSIENHSSTLIEAMMVGVPSVTSYVGGISDYLQNGKNGLFYRFNEPEILASHIIRIFEDDELAQQLSKEAIKSIRKARLNLNIQSEFLTIYNKILQTY